MLRLRDLIRPKAKAKYSNVKTDGYDSVREAKRAGELRLLEKAGEISDLREQVPFDLIPAQYRDGRCIERAANYIADFTYTTKGGQFVVEDCKGVRTKDYVLKRKLMLHLYQIRISEV